MGRIVKSVFIYFLKDPENPIKGYVGKSKTPEKRFRAHLRSQRKWICELRERRLQPSLEIVDEVPEEYWQQLEVAYIEFFRDCGFQLDNRTLGGQGVGNPSEATRKMLSLQKLGEKNPNFGKKPSPEQRAKMSATHKANPNSGTFKPGHVSSPEVLAERSLNMSGDKNPMFGKRPWLGKKHTLETRAKMSEARRRWHENKKIQL